MTPIYKLLSFYADFLLGLKQMRPRLLVFIALLAVGCFLLSMREGAPVGPRIGLFAAACACVLALAVALVIGLFNYTLFQGDGTILTGIPDAEPFAEGLGQPARVSGDLEAGRHRQRFSVVSGGVLREEGQLHVVVPTQPLQVMGGINTENCGSWWRRTLGDEVERVEPGVLWSDGQRLPALRIHRGRLGALTLGAVDPTSFARLIATLRTLEYRI